MNERAYIGRDVPGVFSWEVVSGGVKIRWRDAMGHGTYVCPNRTHFHADVQTGEDGVRVCYISHDVVGILRLGQTPPDLEQAASANREGGRVCCVPKRPDEFVYVTSDGKVRRDLGSTVFELYTPKEPRAPVAIDAWNPVSEPCACAQPEVMVLYRDGWVRIHSGGIERGREDGEPLGVDAQTGARAYRVGEETVIYTRDEVACLAFAARGTGGRWLVTDGGRVDLRNPHAGVVQGVPGAADDGAEFLVCGDAVIYQKHSAWSWVRGPVVRLLAISGVFLVAEVLRRVF